MVVRVVETDRQALFRRSWEAVGVGEAAVLLAGFVALMGILSDLDLCIGLGCSSAESGLGAGAVILLSTAGVLFVAGLCWTAFVSVREPQQAIVRGMCATVALGAAFVLVWVPLRADGFVPALVLGIGVAGAIVVREPTPSSRYVRAAAIALLVLATTVDDSFAFLLFGLLVFPAIGIADTIVLGREVDSER